MTNEGTETVDKVIAEFDLDKECAICTNQFCPTDMVYMTECTHIYHHECLSKWIGNMIRGRKAPACYTCATAIEPRGNGKDLMPEGEDSSA